MPGRRKIITSDDNGLISVDAINVSGVANITNIPNYEYKFSKTLIRNNGDYNAGTLTDTQALQNAVTTESNLGGGAINIGNIRLLPTSTITIPKFSGLKLRGNGYPRVYTDPTNFPNFAGTRIWAGASMASIFDMRGDADVQAYANLGVDFSLSDMELFGNSNVTGQLIYAKSIDTLNLTNCRLRGAPTSVFADFATTLTPVPGANKPGGMFWDHVILSGKLAPSVIIKNSTQNFLSKLWFEQDPAGYGPSHMDLYSVDKTAIVHSEFNYVATAGSAIRLYDTAQDPLTGLIVAASNFDTGAGTTIIQDNRTNVQSRGLFLTGVAVTGTLGTGIVNPHTNIIALASVYNQTKSIIQAGDFTVIGSAGTERIFNFKTFDSLNVESNRAQILISSSGEAGSNAGSNFVIKTFADDGTTARNSLIITRNDGITQVVGLKITDTTNGFILFPQLVGTPGIPATGFYQFADSSGRFSWRGTNGFVRKFDATGLTADRIYTLPDQAGTVLVSGQNAVDFGITKTTADAKITLNTSAGQERVINFQTGAIDRWKLRITNTAEAGANAGSNFALQSFDDAGASLGNALAFTRSSLASTFGGQVSLKKILTISDVAGGVRQINLQTSSSDRFVFGLTSVAESGANVGSNFYVNTYDDTGVFLKVALSVNRATSAVTFGSNIILDSGAVTGNNTPTINNQVGAFTTVTLTTAANTNEILTLTNSLITGSSKVMVAIGSYTGTYGTNGVPMLLAVTPTAGSATILIRNIDPTNALNGVLRIQFTVF